jgi:ATP-dependent exoDNAse (exonuclease V) alpha subunit
MVRTLFPVLNYGYAITLYKSQGSEYKTVFINLSSIKYSMLKNITSAVSLFKATYTAASRASDNMYIAYID